MKISAIVNVKNEESMLAACLQSVAFCNELIVIDTGSTDNTIEIAKSMHAKVYVHKTEDFSEMKMFGLQKAIYPWVLYIDADERVTEVLRKNIQNAIQDNKYVAYRIIRQNYYFGDVAWPKKELFLRLFQKKHLKQWEGKLHETAIVDGPVGTLNGDLLHYTHRDFSSMVKKTVEWSKIEAKLRFDSNHKAMHWWRFPSVMLRAFFHSYIAEQGWKVGTAGLIESLYQAFSIFITYARLWELQRHEKQEH